jgi:hypothetical protein
MKNMKLLGLVLFSWITIVQASEFTNKNPFPVQKVYFFNALNTKLQSIKASISEFERDCAKMDMNYTRIYDKMEAMKGELDRLIRNTTSLGKSVKKSTMDPLEKIGFITMCEILNNELSKLKKEFIFQEDYMDLILKESERVVASKNISEIVSQKDWVTQTLSDIAKIDKLLEETWEQQYTSFQRVYEKIENNINNKLEQLIK